MIVGIRTVGVGTVLLGKVTPLRYRQGSKMVLNLFPYRVWFSSEFYEEPDALCKSPTEIGELKAWVQRRFCIMILLHRNYRGTEHIDLALLIP